MPEDQTVASRVKHPRDWFARLVAGLGLLVAITSLAFTIWRYHAERETRLALRCDPVLGEPIKEPGRFIEDVEVPLLVHCRLTNTGSAVVYFSDVDVSTAIAGERVKLGMRGRTGRDRIDDRGRQILEFDLISKSLRERSLPVRLEANAELEFYVNSQVIFGPGVIDGYALNDDCRRQLGGRQPVGDVLQACLGGRPLGDWDSPFAASVATRYKLTTIIEARTSTGVSVKNAGATILILR